MAAGGCGLTPAGDGGRQGRSRRQIDQFHLLQRRQRAGGFARGIISQDHGRHRWSTRENRPERTPGFAQDALRTSQLGFEILDLFEQFAQRFAPLIGLLRQQPADQAVDPPIDGRVDVAQRGHRLGLVLQHDRERRFAVEGQATG